MIAGWRGGCSLQWLCFSTPSGVCALRAAVMEAKASMSDGVLLEAAPGTIFADGIDPGNISAW